jgi:hypothetical protein
MRIVPATVALFALLGGIGCVQRADDEPPSEAPAVYWYGDLTELDGTSVDSGISIEIKSVDPETNPEAVIYELATGCRAGGFVSAGGRVQAMEVLRPCLAADGDRMARLSDISYSSVSAEPRQPANLTWEGGTATLRSAEGSARFVERGTSSSR